MGTVYTDCKTSQVYILMQITLLRLEGKNRIKWRWYRSNENEAHLKGPGLLPSLCFGEGFPAGSDDEEPACNAGDLGLIPGLERSSRGGHGNPLQNSCLENPHGQRSLVGYSPWGCKESDPTERLGTAQHMLWGKDHSRC